MCTRGLFVEARGQIEGIVSLFHHVVLRVELRSPTLEASVYLLNNLLDPQHYFYYKLKSGIGEM